MLIRSVRVLNYGPFAVADTLFLEPDVTVLTGANDVGKSSLLRLLGYIGRLDGKAQATSSEFNQDRLFDGGVGWSAREDFGADVEFILQQPLAGTVTRHMQGFSHVTGRMKLGNDKSGWKIARAHAGDEKHPQQVDWPFPEGVSAVWLPPDEQVGNIINLESPNPLEARLLRRAFGQQFDFPAFKALDDMSQRRAVAAAEERLNRLMSGVMPAELALGWRLRDDTERKDIALMLTDRHGGLTPLGSRGSGVRKVASILAHLMDHPFDGALNLVLFDEPENSLHADSQHLLRRLLEGLAARPNVQVIYSTHSPSMINVIRPQSLRLLRRTADGGKATTRIDNKPFQNNFVRVRASLGLSAADSLLYAPLTVIVEGDTEVVGLPLLLLKLKEAGILGFEKVDELLGLCHFLDGMGDQFGYLCGLAKSQGTTPIVFLDGDKRRNLPNYGLDGVPVVFVDGDSEFEQLVPRAVYIQAVASVIEADSGALALTKFEEWEKTGVKHPRMAFTKRVNAWLTFLDLPDLNKARVMRKAIESVEPKDVTTGPLLELLRNLDGLAPSTPRLTPLT
jgi:hypothetical protein